MAEVNESSAKPADGCLTRPYCGKPRRCGPFMTKTFISYLILFAIIGCTSPKKERTKEDATNDMSSPEPSPKEIMKQLAESYSMTFSIDTEFTIQNKKYELKLRHFCTMDNGLKIPAKYNFDTHSEFITHNFESTFLLLKGQDTIANKTIDKNLFRALLSPELDSFATISFPNFRLSNDSIELDYSISIPATDVGVPATIKFDRSGKFTISN